MTFEDTNLLKTVKNNVFLSRNDNRGHQKEPSNYIDQDSGESFFDFVEILSKFNKTSIAVKSKVKGVHRRRRKINKISSLGTSQLNNLPLFKEKSKSRKRQKTSKQALLTNNQISRLMEAKSYKEFCFTNIPLVTPVPRFSQGLDFSQTAGDAEQRFYRPVRSILTIGGGAGGLIQGTRRQNSNKEEKTERRSISGPPNHSGLDQAVEDNGDFVREESSMTKQGYNIYERLGGGQVVIHDVEEAKSKKSHENSNFDTIDRFEQTEVIESDNLVESDYREDLRNIQDPSHPSSPPTNAQNLQKSHNFHGYW